jgi:hypothetical protein
LMDFFNQPACLFRATNICAKNFYHINAFN